MKIRVKVVCSFLTLSKKPPLFSNPGYAREYLPGAQLQFIDQIALAKRQRNNKTYFGKKNELH